MSDGVNQLGRKVRGLREARGLSLRSLAAKAGVSESFVSQVERGQANPSVASLRRISQALETSIGFLFEDGSAAGRVIKASQRARLVHPQRKWEDSLLTPRNSQRLEVILSHVVGKDEDDIRFLRRRSVPSRGLPRRVHL
jgi:transcriptional regulator with XRE-family HTH domain